MKTNDVSIAVMPFRNLSPELETDYFSIGFVEDLTAELTRFPSLRVIASQSSLSPEFFDQSETDVPRGFDLDFFLNGSVRRDETNLRVSVQLVRAQGREAVWAERFDTPLEQIFEIRDSIASTIAGRLSVQVDEARLKSARDRSAESLPAYESWLQGMDCLRRGTLEGDEESRPFFRKALEIDPQYARGYAGLSLSHFNEWTCHAWHLWDENEQNAFDYAQKASQLDDRDAMVQSVLARVHNFRYQHRQANQHAEKALALNPNDARVLIQVAIIKLFNGEPQFGYELAMKATELNPLHDDWYLGIAGWNLFMLGNYEEANRYLEKAGETITNFPAYRAACAALSGDIERARNEYDTFLKEYQEKIAFGREPATNEALTWAVQVEPFLKFEDSSLMPDALRDAGIAEIDVATALKSRSAEMVRPADISQPPGNRFVREGELWSLSYEGAGAQLVGLKGFFDIARLLATPGEAIHCLELSGIPGSSEVVDDVLDSQARREYRLRIEELQRDLERADEDNDSARAEAARIELDSLIDELAKATGLGGRSRQMNHTAERARSAVTWRIRSAIKKISAAHPRLGQHLSNSISTGYLCSYTPEGNLVWDV